MNLEKGKKHGIVLLEKWSLIMQDFNIQSLDLRGLEINNAPKFCEVIFSLDKAKNADIALAMASIFNAV